MDKIKIIETIERIKKNQKYLNSITDFKNEKEYKNNQDKYYGSSMILFTNLNEAIEIGEELIVHFDLEPPTRYADIFSILEEAKIISEKTGEFLTKHMHTRNMLAHQYGKIDPKKVWQLFQEKEYFQTFINEVKNIIKKEEEKSKQNPNPQPPDTKP
ncbi:MAG: type VII toxin-antitoxin system HepT family RNase toxin [Nanoarchaeota archaeon]